MTNGLESIIKTFDSYDYYLHGKVARDIEENRKGQFVLRFCDKDGQPLPDVHVRAEQKKHEFRFGCGTFYLDHYEDEFRRQNWRDRFKDIFNYAVVPLYWDTLEPIEGQPRFEKDSSFIYRRPPVDSVMDFCQENGIRTKGHCLVYNSFQPDWISDDNQTLKRQIAERIRRIAERYGDSMYDYDVINEMITVYKNAYRGNGARNLQVTDEHDHEKWAFEMCRRYLPEANLYWNEGMYETFGDAYRGFRSFYYLMIEKMLREGVRIDGIGMQYHAFAKPEDAAVKLRQVCHPLRILDVMERYGDFGLPIHISEITIPSYTNERADEELQAELVRRLYPLWFGSRYCEAVVWWNLADNTAFGRENAYRAGLLREDGSPKPAYTAIADLIQKEWHTSVEDTVSGELRFGGFYGDYEVEVEHRGQRSVHTVRLHKDNTGYDNRLCDFRAKEIVLA